MEIVVCVKQTPDPAEARFDEKTKRLVREDVPLRLSSLDRRALLEALRLRETVGGTVTVISLGPPQARSVLIEGLALGADKAVLLTDPVFAGSDTLATARSLSAALRQLNPDLVMCGKFTIDSETSQVPGEIAEFLGWPQITSVRAVQTTDTSDVLSVERETDEGADRYEITLPALFSVTELVIKIRRTSPEEIEAAQSKPVTVWSAADVGIEPSTVGIEGSPTRVADLRSAQLERRGEVISSESPEDAAEQLTQYMVTNGLFQSSRETITAQPRRETPPTIDPSKTVWAVAELVDGKLRPVSLEMLGKAQDLADRLGGEVGAVLIGGSKVGDLAPTLGAHGADLVYVAADDTLATYDTAAYTAILASAIQNNAPYAVMLPSTTNGRDLAARLAARLELGLTGDCVDLELDGDGELAQIKPAFGGNIVAPIYSSTTPALATIRPGMLEARSPRDDVTPRIVELNAAPTDPRVRLIEPRIDSEPGATKLDDAEVVVGIGNGIGGQDNIPVVQELVESVDGALAASLRVASARWVSPQLQIGLTGKAVTPLFYIAVGISGQANHLFGTRKTRHVIAINNDPEAPIFKGADIGVVGDWAEIVPALTQALRAAKAQSARD